MNERSSGRELLLVLNNVLLCVRYHIKFSTKRLLNQYLISYCKYSLTYEEALGKNLHSSTHVSRELSTFPCNPL